MTQKRFRIFAWALFILLLGYLLLRAAFVSPSHDEIATFFFYIYHGDYYGDTIVLDANNHLLNSFIGHEILYPIVKDNFFWLRFPNILAFCLWFWSSYKLSLFYSKNSLRFLTLVALNSVPLLMEYFAYTRGYGISLALFLCFLFQVTKWMQAYELKRLFYACGALLFAVSANLTFINTALLFIAFCVIFILLNRQKMVASLWKCWLLIILFSLSLLPFIRFSLKLKDAGALYYGATDGIWDVTGRSLSNYALFNDGWLAAIVVGSAITFILFVLFRQILKKGSIFLQQVYVFPLFLFVGNLIGIVALAVLLDVNYPEDRTAFYLIPLFILLFSHSLDQINGKWIHVQWVYLFFPLSFFLHMSLKTSVFSPDDRMNDSFYKKTKAAIKPEHSLMIYHIMLWNWPRHESYSPVKSSYYNSNNSNSILTDIIVRKTNMPTNPMIPKLYDTIAVDPGTYYISYKRKKPVSKQLLLESRDTTFKSNAEYGLIWEFDPLPKLNGEPAMLTVKGHLNTYTDYNKLHLVVQTVDTNEQMVDYWYYPFETVFHGQKIDESFEHQFLIENLDLNETKVKVYIWNRKLMDFKVTGGKCYLYQIKP
jgi:hypothetical protein